jgi:hypothetical protein
VTRARIRYRRPNRKGGSEPGTGVNTSVRWKFGSSICSDSIGSPAGSVSSVLPGRGATMLSPVKRASTSPRNRSVVELVAAAFGSWTTEVVPTPSSSIVGVSGEEPPIS